MNQIISEDVMYLNILDASNHINDMENQSKNDKKNFAKIYGNAFALLLLKGYKCTSVSMENNTGYMLSINGKEYVCDEESLKSILFKDFDSVMENCLV